MVEETPVEARPGLAGRRRRWVLPGILAGVVVVALAVAVLASREGSPGSASGVTAYTAQARAGTSTADMLELEGQIVGADAVVAPGEGLPDVAAFHRAGVAGMKVAGTTLTVTFLDDASQAQRDRVRSVLRASPLVVSVTSTTSR